MGKAAEQTVALAAVDIEARSSDSAESSQELIVKPISTWKGYVWDTWELPKEERWLLFKVDAFVLTFASVRSPRSFAMILCSVIWLIRLHRSATSSRILINTTSIMHS